MGTSVSPQEITEHSIPFKRTAFYADPSLWLLLFANLFTIFLAVKEQWDIRPLMWIYWFQSVIIGVFNVIKIMTLKNFSTEGLLVNGKPVKPTYSTKMQTGFFFLIHYGFFHLGYFLFLATNSAPIALSPGVILSIALAVTFFFVNHLFSFLYHRREEMEKKYNLGTLLFFPYARIFPMHFTFIFAGTLIQSTGALVLFLFLRTGADLIMHIVHHRSVK